MKAVGRTRRHIIQRAGLIALFAGVLHVFLAGYSCGGDLLDGSKGEGEPCTRSGECQESLVCTAGVCRGSDGGRLDGGQHDGSLDGAIDDASTSTDASLMDAEIDNS